MSEVHNASQFPRIFYTKHMQPGLAGYENETILVDTDAIKGMLKSALGKPVYVHHQDVKLDKLKETASGYITDSFYNEMDGWAWFKILAIDDECHKAIDKGWSVSNAYMPSAFGPGGTKNNCAYDREIRNGEFTHLAIVPNPRYEGACIMSPDEFRNYQERKQAELTELRNSKSSTGGKPMLKLFKNTKQEVTEIDADTLVALPDGKEISIGEMVNSVAAAKQKSDEEKRNAQMTVEVAGEKMSVTELVSAYELLNAKKSMKKNEEDDKEDKEEKKNKKSKVKKNDEEDDDEMENGEECDYDEKKNAKQFEELRNAHLKSLPAAEMIDAPQTMLERGKQRY